MTIKVKNKKRTLVLGALLVLTVASMAWVAYRAGILQVVATIQKDAQQNHKKNLTKSNAVEMGKILENLWIWQTEFKRPVGYPLNTQSLLTAIQTLPVEAEHEKQWQDWLKSVQNPYTRDVGSAAVFANFTDYEVSTDKHAFLGKILYQPRQCQGQSCRAFTLWMVLSESAAPQAFVEYEIPT
jgi:hypothetical protein